MFKLALIGKGFRNLITSMIDVSFGTSRRNFRSSVSAKYPCFPKELKIHTTRREQCHNGVIVDRTHFIG